MRYSDEFRDPAAARALGARIGLEVFELPATDGPPVTSYHLLCGDHPAVPGVH